MCGVIGAYAASLMNAEDILYSRGDIQNVKEDLDRLYLQGSGNTSFKM